MMYISPMRTSNPDATTTTQAIKWISNFLTLAAVVAAAALGFIILQQNSNVSSHFIVYTGMRTRDGEQPNVFPVITPENDAFTRAYACMMDAGIARDPGQCSTQETVKDFRTCVQGRPGSVQCDQHIATQSDIATLKCLQRNYNVTIRQTNVFTECLSLSQPMTFQSIQNINSEVFLGSYNYAVLLCVALTIIASFVVLTAGGWYHHGSIEQCELKGKHIWGWWSPFSIYRAYVSWAWNVVALLFAFGIAYMNDNFNYANQEDSTKRFPVTLWTCMLSIGSFAVVVAFYTYYLFEWAFAGAFAVLYPPRSADAEGDGGATNVVPSEAAAKSMFYRHGGRRSTSRLSATAMMRRPFQPSHWNKRHGSYIGVQLYDESVADAEVRAQHIAPLMLQAFAWTWVFSDGLFFVGMLTPQSSITHESVVRVFFGITAARLFQLAGAYLADKAYLNEKTEESPTDNDFKRGVIISAVMVQLASLISLVATFIEFMSTVEFSRIASLSASGVPSYYIIQIFFLVTVGIMPEVLKSYNIFSAINTVRHNAQVDPDGFLTFAEIIYTWEWVARLIIAYITVLPLGELVRNKMADLSSFMVSTA